MRSVVHLTSAHSVNDVRIFEKECRSLKAAGYDVTLIAPCDSCRVVDGIKIVALPQTRSRRKRITEVARLACALALRENADVYHFHDPELIPTGLLLRMRGKKVVYDVHENLPSDILHNWKRKHPLIRRVLSTSARALEIIAGQACSGIVTITKSFANRFPEHKVWIVANYPILSDQMHPAGVPYLNREPIVVASGSLTPVRCAREMVQAMEMVDPMLSARLMVAGQATDEALVGEISAGEKWPATKYLGRLQRSEVCELYDQARVALLLNMPRPDYQSISTNRLYEYLLKGLPIVASNIPSWRRSLEEMQCGIVVDSNEPGAIAAAIEWMLKHPEEAARMGERGRAAVLDRFTWSSEEKSLLDCYDTLLGDPA